MHPSMAIPRFSDRPLDVVGIGNAIVDVLVQADDAFLDAHSLSKGNMALVDEAQSKSDPATSPVAPTAKVAEPLSPVFR